MRQGRPTREGYIEVPGGRVWFQIIGSGNATPLLILHGGPGFAHDYLEPLEELAGERSIVFYDQLGCGKSDQPDDATLWRTERFVAELQCIREQLDLRRIHLLGHSWGSMLAIDYLLTLPTGVQSFICASPCLSTALWIRDAALHREALPRDVQLILNRHEKAGFINCPEYQGAALLYYKRYLCRLDNWPEALERSYLRLGGQVYDTMWGANEFWVTGNLRDYDRTDRLRELTVPTLFTCGRYDEATPETTKLYHDMTPGSEIMVFEESAHVPHLEEPEQYLSVIGDFLRKVELKLKSPT
jgi:proline iminopeptidase